MISFGDQENFGIYGAYGLYGLNLNALFNPVGYSPILPQLKQVSWHQYEGFMYLGVGMMLLLITFILYSLLAFIIRIKTKPEVDKGTLKRDHSHLPLWILIITYTIFSITLVITYNDKVLFKIPAPHLFIKLEEIFRASARFFWTPYYLIILFTIIGFAKSRIKPIISAFIIVFFLIIQIYDLNRLLTSKNISPGAYHPPMKSADWIKLMGRFDEILFFPAFNTPPIRDMAYQDFSYLAFKAGKPVNAAYVARENSAAIKAFTDSLAETVASGVLSRRALYITDSVHLLYFSKAIRSYSAIVDSLDGCFYIIAEPRSNIVNDSLQTKSKNILNSLLEKSNLTGFMETSSLPVVDSSTIRYNIETINIGKGVISMGGWAFIDSSLNNENDSIFITLNSKDQFYLAPVKRSQRPDVASAFNRPTLVNCGLGLLVFTDNVKSGTYQIGLAIKNEEHKFAFQFLGREVNLKKSEFVAPLNIHALPPEGKIISDLIIEENASFYSASGWAAIENQHADSSIINLILKNEQGIYLISTEPYPRPDVTASFKNQYKLDNSGFGTKFLKAALPKGKYQVGFLIQDRRRKAETVFFTEKEINNYEK